MSIRAFSGCKAAAAAAGLAAVAALAPAAQAGPVTIVSQEQGVGAFVEAPGVGNDDDDRSATEPGLFDESVSAEVSGDGFLGRATASLTSSFVDNTFRFASSVSYDIQETRDNPDSPGRVAAAATAITVFTLDEPYRYELNTDSNDSEGVQPERFEAPFEFTGFSSVDFPDLVEGNVGDDTLSEGTYRIVFPLAVEDTPGRPELTSFAAERSATLELSPVDGDGDGDGNGGGGEPNPIPLPPAVWAGLSVMGLGLLNRWRKSLRA